jgi:hypothetical protein
VKIASVNELAFTPVWPAPVYRFDLTCVRVGMLNVKKRGFACSTIEEKHGMTTREPVTDHWYIARQTQEVLADMFVQMIVSQLLVQSDEKWIAVLEWLLSEPTRAGAWSDDSRIHQFAELRVALFLPGQ